MSVFSELVNEWGVHPDELDARIRAGIEPEPAPWNLPEIDLVEIFGPLNLRQAFLMISGDTPTTYSARMAAAMRAITDGSLLALDEEPVDAQYTQALNVIQSLRNPPVEAEVLDD